MRTTQYSHIRAHLNARDCLSLKVAGFSVARADLQSMISATTMNHITVLVDIEDIAEFPDMLPYAANL